MDKRNENALCQFIPMAKTEIINYLEDTYLEFIKAFPTLSENNRLIRLQEPIVDKYILNPEVKNTFIAYPKYYKDYGKDAIMLIAKLPSGWNKEIKLSHDEQAYFNLEGLDKKYHVKIKKIDILKNNKTKKYWGLSIKIDEENVLEFPFTLLEIKLLLSNKKIGLLNKL